MSLTRKTAYKCDQYNKSVRLFFELASKSKTGFTGTYKYMTFLHHVIWGTWKSLKLCAEPKTIIFVSVTTYDFMWRCMTMYEFWWLCMTMYDYVLLYMTMYAYIWLCMTLCDYVWLDMTMRERERVQSMETFRKF